MHNHQIDLKFQFQLILLLANKQFYNYNYQSNASYYFAGCYSSIKPDGSFVDFVNYNLDQNINFNNNQVNVKITQHGTCALWTDISVQGSILVQYK